MITYEKFWKTVEGLGLKKQDLVEKLGFSKGLMDNLKHNRSIPMNALDYICNKLKIKPEDVFAYTYEKMPVELDIDSINNK